MEGLTEKVGTEKREYTDEQEDNVLRELDELFQITDAPNRTYVVMSLEEIDDGISSSVSIFGMEAIINAKSMGKVELARKVMDEPEVHICARAARAGIRDHTEKWINDGMSLKLGAIATATFESDEELSEFIKRGREAIGFGD